MKAGREATCFSVTSDSVKKRSSHRHKKHSMRKVTYGDEDDPARHQEKVADRMSWGAALTWKRKAVTWVPASGPASLGRL